jgi:hypothetical protein
VAIIGARVEHPKIGPVLFDTGAAANFKELWPPVVQELFAITEYESEHRLDVALQATGHGLEDVWAIVLSHLHLEMPAAWGSSAAATSPFTCTPTS